MFLGLLDPGPDPLVISTGPAPDLAPVPDPHPSIIKTVFLLHLIVKIIKFFLPANLSRTVPVRFKNIPVLHYFLLGRI
jgi:hypothetical protein